MSLKNQPRYEEVLDRIVSAGHLNDLQHVVCEVRDAYRLANIAYHASHLPNAETPNPILILTYEQEWVKRYKELDYFKIDPVVLSGTKGFLPLDWSSVDHETRMAQDFFHEAGRFGVGRQGVTLPIRGKSGERALFTVTANMSDREWQSRRVGYMREFQLIAHYFHDRAVQLSGYRVENETLQLSVREMQCLEFTSDGLVPKRIADKLGITDRMVRMYLSSGCVKLGCANVHQAITRLVTLEIIQPILKS